MSPPATPRVSEVFADRARYEYFATEAHYRSLTGRILAGFRAGSSTIVVTGEPIADARRLAEALRETGVWQKAVLERNQHVTATEAAGHREVAAQNGATPVVVVLDDVDRLSDEQLLEFHRSHCLGDRRIANAVILASPAFVARSEKSGLAGLKLGPGSRIPFQHLGMDEVEAFIRHQLPPEKRDLVTKDGVSAIANASGGDPALVNRLADVMLQYKARARGKSEQALPSVKAPEHSVPSEPGPSQRSTEHAPGPPSGEPRHPRESGSASSGGQAVQSACDGAVMGSKRSEKREGASSVAQAVQSARAAVGAERSEKGGPDWSSEHGAQDARGGALNGAEASGSIPTACGGAVEAVPRAVSLRAFGSDQANKDFTEHGRATNHVQAETAPSKEVPGNFFAHTAPPKVELGFENAPPSVPERIVSKLQLRPAGNSTERGREDTAPIVATLLAERPWRRSTRALVVVVVLALVAAGMAGFVYGSKVEQVMLASRGQVATRLHELRVKPGGEGLTSPAQTEEPNPGAEIPPVADAAKQQDPSAAAPSPADRELTNPPDVAEPSPAKKASPLSTGPSVSSGTVPLGPRPISQAPTVTASRQEAPSMDVAALVARGDELFALRDIVSARRFYERAAAAGDGRGALHMGMTFDPAFLGRAGLQRTQTDPEQAMSWYRRASALGSAEAEQLQEALTPKQK